jgi:hypothetical protein
MAPFMDDGGDPAGGWTRGWTVGIGRFVKRDGFSVEIELSQTGVLTKLSDSVSFRGTVYDSRRDRMIGANFRFHMDNRANHHFEPLLGIGLLQYQCWTQTAPRSADFHATRDSILSLRAAV